MPQLQAFNISYQLDNGTVLFQDLSLSLDKPRTGLVGKNGAGKSVLASILTSELSPSSGSIARKGNIAIYRQTENCVKQQSIAEFLGIDNILDAISKIAQGHCGQALFDTVGDRWELTSWLEQSMLTLGLPTEPTFNCANLSGGQFALLRLWQLFESHSDILILDEPSNHLDNNKKQWLIEAINNYSGAILLISHDRELLNEMEQTWELSPSGLKVYGGNYSHYRQQSETERNAIERRLGTLDKQKHRLIAKEQENREKAQKRASKSNRMRKDGSQSKMLLNAMKNSATASAGTRAKNAQHREGSIEQQQQHLASQYHLTETHRFYIRGDTAKPKTAFSLQQAQLAFGTPKRINLSVHSRQKLHLEGSNGCGKSTLMKSLLGHTPLKTGELTVNTPLYYLDQHFGSLHHEQSLLDNVMNQVNEISPDMARTLLAGIGMRGDSVYQSATHLSGGEKMKLAMLIAGQQSDFPFLLLDEPDNHLDIDSKTILSQALSDYQGGFLLISHDKYFVNECGISHSYHLG